MITACISLDNTETFATALPLHFFSLLKQCSDVLVLRAIVEVRGCLADGASSHAAIATGCDVVENNIGGNKCGAVWV